MQDVQENDVCRTAIIHQHFLNIITGNINGYDHRIVMWQSHTLYDVVIKNNAT